MKSYMTGLGHSSPDSLYVPRNPKAQVKAVYFLVVIFGPNLWTWMHLIYLISVHHGYVFSFCILTGIEVETLKAFPCLK